MNSLQDKADEAARRLFRFVDPKDFFFYTTRIERSSWESEAERRSLCPSSPFVAAVTLGTCFLHPTQDNKSLIRRFTGYLSTLGSVSGVPGRFASVYAESCEGNTDKWNKSTSYQGTLYRGSFTLSEYCALLFAAVCAITRPCCDQEDFEGRKYLEDFLTWSETLVQDGFSVRTTTGAYVCDFNDSKCLSALFRVQWLETSAMIARVLNDHRAAMFKTHADRECHQHNLRLLISKDAVVRFIKTRFGTPSDARFEMLLHLLCAPVAVGATCRREVFNSLHYAMTLLRELTHHWDHAFFASMRALTFNCGASARICWGTLQNFSLEKVIAEEYSFEKSSTPLPHSDCVPSAWTWWESPYLRYVPNPASALRTYTLAPADFVAAFNLASYAGTV